VDDIFIGPRIGAGSFGTVYKVGNDRLIRGKVLLTVVTYSLKLHLSAFWNPLEKFFFLLFR
jgi:hypothetical protein